MIRFELNAGYSLFLLLTDFGEDKKMKIVIFFKYEGIALRSYYPGILFKKNASKRRAMKWKAPTKFKIQWGLIF